MGIMDTLADFIDNDGLADAFAVRPDDSFRLRRPLLDGIKRAREQFAERGKDIGKSGSRWWQLQNGVVAFTVRIGGGVLDLGGSPTNHIPERVFDAFLDKLEQAVGNGELDDALKARNDEKIRLQKAARRHEPRSRIAGERHPCNDREDWDNLTWAQRQTINALYRDGKNPDGSVIVAVGYKPDAPLSA